ncbi:RNA cytidine acetyltransferase-like isoform X2 [Lingula anatina]|nr:RNA cytidine acetyltransferase-like isoform X2 [Lingula anatina]|eukprot:XP_023932402.1 RNA cytidine acetyltransferase-like isoform X2 [Lingula anatina]
MTMDVHARFRTESHQDVVGRFNERFLLSLASCKRCMVIDDQLNVLPVSSHTLQIQPVPPKTSDDPLPPSEQELKELKESLQDTQPVGVLVDSCKTLDQAKAVLKFVEAISEKTLRSTVSLTAARGRGKSAALGLAIAAAVGFGYSNIFVTSPSPENLKTVFEFVFKGFDSLEYQEHLDYELVQSTNPEFNNAIVRVNIFREHRQTIQYIHPGDAHKLGQAELVCIDEAAAIPLPLVKNLLGPYLVFMASTVNGYEGTGRSLSLKLLQQLRQQNVTFGKQATDQQKGAPGGLASATGRILHEISLTESIRYGDGDAVEQWLNEVLCLDASNVQRISSGCPVPENCDLYYVNRDTLFSYHKASEAFLQRIMGLYVASHYKNTPNDLQMLSDAPAHHIFVLLGPVDPTQNTLPEVLCVLQVCLEGEISKSNIMNSLSRGKRASGDLIPWTISQQFQDHDFPQLSGGRVVRIATHPDYQGMGYGTRALEILQHYYEGKIPSLVEDAVVEEAVPTVSKDAVGLLEERIAPRKNLPPLLLKLSERPAEKLDYLGVSYGLTAGLLKFWKRSGFIPVYLRQTPNDLTGEHSCIMLKVLNEGEKTEQEEESWLMAFWKDFRRRFLSLLSYQFRTFHPSLSLSILQQKQCKEKESVISAEELDNYFTKYDLKRLELYSQNMVDYHLIMDLLPSIARLHFLNKTGVHISAVQAAILVSMGLQHKSVEDVEKDMEVPSSQLLGLFNRVIRKMVQQFNQIAEEAVEKDMVARKEVIMEPVKNSLDQELGEAAAEVAKKQKKDLELLKDADLSQYTIKGSEGDWENALTKGTKGLLSVKSGVQEKRKSVDSTSFEQQTPGKHKKHKKQKHHKH